jgi:hypothetical protein
MPTVFVKPTCAILLSLLALCAALAACNKADSGRGFQKDNPTASSPESTANVLPGKHSHGGKKKGKKKGGKSNDDKGTAKPGKAGKAGKAAKPAATPTPP